MTDADWLTGTHPAELLRAVRGRVSHRKLRLLACACCRRFWDELDPPARRRVEAAEAMADGAERDACLVDAYARPTFLLGIEPVAASDVTSALGWPDEHPHPSWSFVQVGRDLIPRDQIPGLWGEEATGAVLNGLHQATRRPVPFDPPSGPSPSPESVLVQIRLWQAENRERVAQADRERAARADLVRDIIPSPFRPVAFDPDWRTAAAVALARQMYDARDFAHAPILADALEDAGCADPAVLGHLRGPGPHARGCWPVDLVLGRE